MRNNLFLNVDDINHAVSQFFQYFREFMFQLSFQTVTNAASQFSRGIQDHHQSMQLKRQEIGDRPDMLVFMCFQACFDCVQYVPLEG